MAGEPNCRCAIVVWSSDLYDVPLGEIEPEERPSRGTVRHRSGRNLGPACGQDRRLDLGPPGGRPCVKCDRTPPDHDGMLTPGGEVRTPAT